MKTNGFKQMAGSSKRLLSEAETIEFLGLDGRPNPGGALRWMIRTRKLGHVRLGKGIYGFRQDDLERFIDANSVPAAG